MPDATETRELVRALDVRRNVAIGFGSGVALSVFAYAFRIGELAGPNPDTRGSPALFLVLAFVLAVTVGLLVSAILTVRSAIRLADADEVMDHGAEWGEVTDYAAEDADSEGDAVPVEGESAEGPDRAESEERQPNVD